MSDYYNPHRSKNFFNPDSNEPFRLSRSKIDLFLECPRCFYIDRRLGTGRPPGYPFSLNSAVDKLLKKEFDFHRVKGTSHPFMEAYGIDAVPFQHEKMDEWRDSLRGGVKYLHEPTNFLVTGGVDDIWQSPNGELLVVDYKATSKNGEVGIDADWQIAYKRQIEVYQWLLRRNGFKVSDTGYFVYVNGDSNKDAFDKKLEFDVKVIPYKGNDSWIDGVLKKAHEVLMKEEIPDSSPNCDYCAYHQAVLKHEKDQGLR